MSLKDLCFQYDLTVRNLTVEMIQFGSRCNGLDTTYIEVLDRSMDFQRVLDHIKVALHYADADPLDYIELYQALKIYPFQSCEIDFEHD